MKLIDLIPLKEQDDEYQKRQDALTPGKNPDAFYKNFDKVKAAANKPAPTITKVYLKMSNIEDEVTIIEKPGNNLKDVTISWGNESHTVNFDDVEEVDNHGNEGLDLEAIAESDDGRWQFILDVYAEATYPMTGDFAEWDWEELIIQTHPDNEDHLDPEDRSDFEDEEVAASIAAAQDDINTMEEGSCTEQEIAEGTCGYTQTVDGKKLKTPGGTKGPKPLNERFQQLAGIKPLYEQGFDAGLANAMGMSDDEFEDQVASRDIEPHGDSFPQDTIDDLDDIDAAGYSRASDLIDKLRQDYRSMSDEELNSFSVTMLLHFIENTSAAAAAKIHFGKRGL